MPGFSFLETTMAGFFTYISCVLDLATRETVAWIDTGGSPARTLPPSRGKAGVQ
jgi:hypothetical protein